jgi:hypothetical protein
MVGSRAMTSMKIGFLGSGDVSKVLGAGFIQQGHSVKLGSREPGKLQDWVQKQGPRASAGSFEEAARFGDIIVLATLGTGTENAIQMAGVGNFDGKVVIDTTNPLEFRPNAMPTLFVGTTDSLGERVQRWLPKARVVKAYNTVGSLHMVNPSFPDGTPDMFICGNDEAAKKTVTDICKGFGWPTIDTGDIENSRFLEPLAMVWIRHYFRTRTGNHAFKLLKK